ncbi:Hypothetical predicted protein [Lecanosticta acicola]|uniref:Uncharacterized protein n=1 Tax=Lecanosticta acicola TaxID=111012 RepID=A0AAI8YWY1_9PEZI|nr:Hypothetical predicted protein [Lecanosticta acicola]
MAQINPDQVFRLLDLPLELWSYICKLAITDEQIITSDTLQHQANRVRPPPLLQTRKVMRVELGPYYYRNKTDIHSSGPTMDRLIGQWLRGVDPLHRPVTRVYVLAHSSFVGWQRDKLAKDWGMTVGLINGTRMLGLFDGQARKMEVVFL